MFTDGGESGEGYAFMALCMAQASLIIAVMSYFKPPGNEYSAHKYIIDRDREYVNMIKKQDADSYADF